MSSHPAIAVKITTSVPVFDIYQIKPLTIRIAFTLTYNRPITLLKRYTGLFDGKILHKGGLTFTNTATGQQVSRNTSDICYMGAREGIFWTTRSEYVTLYPGKAHIIQRDIYPMNSPNMRAHKEGWKSISLLEKAGLAGFGDAQTYEVGVSEKAVVHEWIEGSISEILVWQMLGWPPQQRREMIGYTVTDSVSFAVQRFEDETIAAEPESEPVDNCSPEEVPILVLYPTARFQRHGRYAS
jgi:hypothetical protein